jgi:ribosomal-protein-alanine N-acetyltransferase
MRVQDIPQVVLIEQTSFTHPWPEEAFEDEIVKNAFSHPVVARSLSPAADIVAGYCVKWAVLNELHVQNVAVHPQHRGRGLGRYFLEEALEFGRRLGSRAAFLEVRESNAIARRLYLSMGFREVGKRKNYYSKPREAAIQYRKDALDQD